MSVISDDINEIFLFFKNGWNHFENMKVLITGGTGFFGKKIVSSFIHANNVLDLNISLYVVTRNRKIDSNFYKIEDKYSVLKFIHSDIISFSNYTNEINYIIHAASTSNKDDVIRHPNYTLDSILIGTKNILEFAKKQKNIKSLLIISSGAVYGANRYSKIPIPENTYFSIDLNDSFSSYSLGKKTAELYAKNYMSEYNIPIKIARCFTFIGPLMNLNQNLAFTSFMSSFINSKKIIVNNKNTIRSYMYSTDLVNWLLNILVFSKNGSIYNVGSDEQVTMGTLSKKIAAYNHNITVEEKSSNKVNMYVPDIKKIKDELDLKININLDDAIKRVIHYISNKI